MNIADGSSLARQKMNEHGLAEWKVKLDGGKRRAGLCSHTRKTIQLSRYFIENNPPDVVLDTILHEIAHALVGEGHGHDDVWKRKAAEIGAKPERCYREHVEMPKGNYRAKCRCGYESYVFRLRKARAEGRYHHIACGPIDGKLIYEKLD